MIPLFICVDGGPQEILRAAACSGKVPIFREAPARQSSADDAPQRLRLYMHEGRNPMNPEFIEPDGSGLLMRLYRFQ